MAPSLARFTPVKRGAMRLPHDQTSSITFGINLSLMGLCCRGGCSLCFVPVSQSSADALRTSASERDAHERTEHGYDHKIQKTPESWAFTQGFSRRGHTSL